MTKEVPCLPQKYQIIGTIKEGNDKAIYRVVEIRGGKPHFYAAKVFRGKGLSVAQREIRSLISLPAHPYVIKYYDVFFGADCIVLLLEHAEWNLRQRLKVLTLKDKIAVAYQICAGMEALHKVGMVHGDLKPENILISFEGIAKVADFGIAQVFAPQEGVFPVIPGGTPLYESPEQLEKGVSDEQSDIFSFGIILYEMVSGRLPYKGINRFLGATGLRQRRYLQKFYEDLKKTKDFWSDDPYRVWDWEIPMPLALQSIVKGCMMPYRGHRWASFSMIRDAFEQAFPEIVKPYVMQTRARAGQRSGFLKRILRR